jgi:hypothetical protein
MLPNWVLFLFMAVLLAGIVAVLTATFCGLLACVRWLQGAVAYVRSERRTARRRAQLVQLLADPDVQYVPCHALGCGHMSTPHHPDTDGVLRCEACGTPAVR